jgi:serine/threonine protein kinase
MSPQVGDVIAGKYRVERVLGSGGMGVVVAAMHEELEQRVALKVLRPEVIDDEDAVARFAREARAAGRIRSEHVARVLDVTKTASGAPVLVMELLEGCDLERLLQMHGPLATHDAVDLVLEACEGVAAAHAVGVVHRDLKPANLFRADRADGTTAVKVLDFGISKVVPTPGATTRDAGVTGAAMILGSPFYMAPEQLASTRDVDARADVWSLVVVLFELIAGTVPFDGETIPMVQTKILTAPTPSLAALRADVPPDLDTVIQRGLEKRLAQRFPDVAELARALAPFASLTPKRP